MADESNGTIPSQAALLDAEWRSHVREALANAAEIAAAHGVSVEEFASAALTAYAEKNGRFREALQHKQLAMQLAVLRAQGRVAIA